MAAFQKDPQSIRPKAALDFQAIGEPLVVHSRNRGRIRRWADENGYAVLRLGCFAAGCCFGKPCDLPWAVTFDAPFHPMRGAPVHPTQIYYALAAVLTFAALLWARPRLTRPGALVGMFLACYGAFSLVIAFFRADHQPWLLGLSGSQAVLGVLVIIGCALIARPGWNSNPAGIPMLADWATSTI